MNYKAINIINIDSEGLPPTGYLRLKGILALLPIGKTSWWKGVREGRYPEPIKWGNKITLWRVEDIRALFNKINLNQKSRNGGRRG